MEKPTIAVWFSCGAASAVAAKLTLEKYSHTHNVIVVNNPVINEHPDNLRFLKDVENWLGVEIQKAFNPKYPSCDIRDVFNNRKYMSGVKGAPCTSLLKKEARYIFEKSVKIDFHVLGFTSEEYARAERFSKFERSNFIYVLQNTSKGRCFEIIEEAGIKLPEIYSLGFPNANCIGCVKSNSPTYWNLVRKWFPDVFNERAEQSRLIGARLVKIKGKRCFLDELKLTDTGGKIKSWECGIFCDTE